MPSLQRLFTECRSPHSCRRAIPSVFRHRGLSLLELTVSMGLLAIIMIPVISLMGTSYKVMNASSARQSGAYTRQAALDAVSWRLSGSTEVREAQPQSLLVAQADGTEARLSFAGGELLWETTMGVESIITGLADARFSVTPTTSLPPAAGKLFLIEVASRAADEPAAAWSSTQLWIRPAL